MPVCNSEDYSHAYEAEDVWKNFLYVRSLARAALARRAPSAAAPVQPLGRSTYSAPKPVV